MPKKRNKNVFLTPKTLAIYILSMLLLPLPQSNLEAGGSSRTIQKKSEPVERAPTSNVQRGTRAATPAPPRKPTAPAASSNSSRSQNRSQPAARPRTSQPSSSNSSRTNRQTARQPQRTTQTHRTTPSTQTHSQSNVQQRKTPQPRTSTPSSRTSSQAQRNSRTTATHRATRATQPSSAATPSQEPRRSSSSNLEQRRTPPAATSTVNRNNSDRNARPTTTRISNSNSENVRRTTVTTNPALTRTHLERNSRSNAAVTSQRRSQTITTTPSKTNVTRTNTSTAGRNSNRSGPESSNRESRDQTVERSYQEDRETARTVYVDRRRHVQQATGERRERERQQAINGLTTASSKTGASQRNNRGATNTPDRHAGHDHARDHKDDGPSRNARHDDHSKRGHHIDTHVHRHGDGCGHHFYQNRWHDFPSHHRHYDGCGHYQRSNSWISFSIGHVHGIGCGHFYENGIWLSFSGSRHRHHTGCGHFYYSGFWHDTSRYHVHRSGCGHYHYDGRWHNAPQSHIHSDHCEHLYDGSQWLTIHSDTHIHSASCGHHLFSGRWHAYPRSYYTINRENSLYFFVDLGDYQNRNLPQWAYEEYLDNGRPVDIFRSSAALSKAYAAFAKGRYYDSLVQFRSASRQDPKNALIRLASAQAQIAVKDYRAAFEDIVEGLTLFPEWAGAYVNLTEIYSRPEDLEVHTRQLKEWVERYPRDFKAHFVLGYFYYFHQEYDAAKNELLYALSWDDQLEAAHILMDHILAFEAESEVLTREQDLSPSDEAQITTE